MTPRTGKMALMFIGGGAGQCPLDAQGHCQGGPFPLWLTLLLGVAVVLFILGGIQQALQRRPGKGADGAVDASRDEEAPVEAE